MEKPILPHAPHYRTPIIELLASIETETNRIDVRSTSRLPTNQWPAVVSLASSSPLTQDGRQAKPPDSKATSSFAGRHLAL